MMFRRAATAGLLVAALAASTGLAVASPVAGASGGTTSGDALPRRADTNGPTFAIAIIPDTQTEVFGNDPRMGQRMSWLIDHRDQWDLRFVDHTGDVTFWGWLDPPQLSIASAAFTKLENAGIPYSITIGNHDTRAPGWDGHGGYGGDLYERNPECRRRFSDAICHTRVLLRKTQEFNNTFDAARFGDVQGAYESGKVDNIFSTFSAGGLKWLVLSLEQQPRAGVVDWAQQVVSNHPHDNVIVSTHFYLNGRNRPSAQVHNGVTSPKSLWRTFISKNENIQMVFSGHVGQGGSRVSRAADGHKVLAIRGTYHSAGTNPVRVMRINPETGAIHSFVYAVSRSERWTKDDVHVKGMRFVS
jgi:hypothetical protein